MHNKTRRSRQCVNGPYHLNLTRFLPKFRSQSVAITWCADNGRVRAEESRNQRVSTDSPWKRQDSASRQFSIAFAPTAHRHSGAKTFETIQVTSPASLTASKRHAL